MSTAPLPCPEHPAPLALHRAGLNREPAVVLLCLLRRSTFSTMLLSGEESTPLSLTVADFQAFFFSFCSSFRLCAAVWICPIQSTVTPSCMRHFFLFLSFFLSPRFNHFLGIPVISSKMVTYFPYFSWSFVILANTSNCLLLYLFWNTAK